MRWGEVWSNTLAQYDDVMKEKEMQVKCVIECIMQQPLPYDQGSRYPA